MKAKEPFVSLMFSCIYPGLGQIYSGYLKRGLWFIFLSLAIALSFGWYVLQPETRIYAWMLGVMILAAAVFSIYIPVDSYLCAKRYNKECNLERKITLGKRVLYISGVIICLFAASFGSRFFNYFKQNVVQAFKLPSGAMVPTLEIGDRILVYRNAYKTATPQRGDIMVFEFPEDPSRTFIKRVVGLPNEQLEVKDGKILINGSVVENPKIAGRYYHNKGQYAQPGIPVTVPADSYFVMGDNGALSRDSRYWGFVPAEKVLGKAFKIYYPFDRSGRIE